MSERIVWTRGDYSETGRVNGLALFTVGYGVTQRAVNGGMYYMRTTLPIKASVIGQHYPTPTHAKIAAERLLAAFIARISEPVAEEGLFA